MNATKTDEDLNLTFTTKTQDDRRNKSYYREVKLSFQIPYDAQDGLPHTSTVKGVKVPRVQDVLSDMTPKPAHARVSGFLAPRHVSCSVTFIIKANRPSQIITETEARQWLDAAVVFIGDADDSPETSSIHGDRLKAHVEYLILKTLAEQDEIRARMGRQTQAIHLARHAAKDADGKARKIVRFEQRLAALKAELEAEQKVQLAEIVKPGGELDKGVDKFNAKNKAKAIENTEESYLLFDERSVEAARKFADRLLPNALPGLGLPSVLDELAIKLSEVE